MKAARRRFELFPDVASLIRATRYTRSFLRSAPISMVHRSMTRNLSQGVIDCAEIEQLSCAFNLGACKMAADAFAEILQVVNNKALSETGGGHNQKGIEFQRNWALIRMFELESEEQPDFLLLFEAVQDVAVLDSNLAPTKIDIYQIKKKDRSEWSWGDLTNLHALKLGQPSRKPKPLIGVVSSPVGKLYAALRAFKSLTGTARFVSNAGCDLTMEDGTNAATSLPVAMANLPYHVRNLLTDSLSSLHTKGEPPPDLSKIYVERVDIPVDDCATYTVGIAHAFLLARSPPHAGQARALVDTLLAKVGPLGAKTASCSTFEEMRVQRG
jgi:Cap4 dsDNA endonuclease